MLVGRAGVGVVLLITLSVSQGHETCSEGKAARRFDIRSEPSPSVYDGLTLDEMTAVIDYLRGQAEFDLKEGDEATLNTTFIYVIEGLLPSKAEVLAYLDDGSARPERYAWVVLMRGDLSPPVIQDIKVGPLPKPTSHQKLDRHGKGDLEYIRRSINTNQDEEGIYIVLDREMGKVDDLLQQIDGYRYTDCDDHCLDWELANTEYQTGSRTVWINLIRYVEGLYLHPNGLEFRIDCGNELDPDKWVVDYVWFRGTMYRSFDEMAEKVERPNTSKTPEYVDDETLFSSLHQRGDPKPDTPQRGPRCFMPDGRRFSLAGHHVDWQGWTFDFSQRSLTGPQVHDVRFNGERIAYELAISEIAVIYATGNPTFLYSAFVDTTWSLGTESLRLTSNIICPDYAEYFDFAHFTLGKPHVQPNSMCLFEHQRDIPLRYHIQTDWEGSYSYAQGMPDNALILRSVITIAYYDYIFDFVFHQNGAMEIRVTLSGYVFSAWYIDAESGFETHPTSQGVIHNHLMHLKLDLDVLGRNNRFETLDWAVDQVANPVEGRPPLMRQYFTRNLRETELNATYKYNLDTPRYLVIHNKNETNLAGNERGYRILSSAWSKQMMPQTWPVEKSFSWARYQVAVTKQKDAERRAASSQSQEMTEPVVDFQEFIDDDESIIDEDLVAWVTIGSHHIPHSEDVPIVQSPGMSLSVHMLPFNFFDTDPSLASRDNVRVEPKDGDHYDVTYEGESLDITCSPRLSRNITGYGMDDVTVKQETTTKKDATSAAGTFIVTFDCVMMMVLWTLLFE